MKMGFRFFIPAISMSRFIVCHNHSFVTQSNMSECVLFISKVQLNLFFHRQGAKTDDKALNEKINETEPWWL